MNKTDLLNLLQMPEEVFDFLNDKKVTQITHGIPEISGFTTRQVTRRELNPRTGRMVNVTRSEVVPKFSMRYANTPAQLPLLKLAQGWQKEGWEWNKVAHDSFVLTNGEQAFSFWNNVVNHHSPRTVFNFSYDTMTHGIKRTVNISLDKHELAAQMNMSIEAFEAAEGATYKVETDSSVKTEHLVVLDIEVGLFVNGEKTLFTHELEIVNWSNLQFYNGNSTMKEDIPPQNENDIQVVQYILDRPDSRIDPPMCWVEVATGQCYLEFPGHLQG